jgi:hypothetical protein
MEYSAKTSLPLYTIGIIYPLSVFRHLSNWYNVSLIFLVPMGEKVLKGSQMSPFLAINAKGGENISPKRKDRTTTNFKVFKKEVFNWLVFFKLVSKNI